MTTHASNLVLDELAAGLPTDPARLAHVQDCEHCRARLETLRIDRDRISTAPAFRQVLRDLHARPTRTRVWWRRPLWLLPIAGAMAVALLVLPREASDPGDRIKGQVSLTVVREPTGEPVLGDLRPGERISLAVGGAGARFLLVMAVSEEGAVSPVWPPGGSESGVTPKGAAARLEPSFFVTPGSMQLTAFFTEQPLSVSRVTEALQKDVERTRREGHAPMSAAVTFAGEANRATLLICVEGSSCSSQR